jgi:2-polyprenyl-3-methyl-5-hydroxy-6-metoxy-1,4-benzoquinol methylase
VDSRDWDDRYASGRLGWAAEPGRLVMEEITYLPPGRALDLGAGAGRNAVWLALQGWRVTGVDYSAVGLEKARLLAEARGVRVDWVRTDVREYQPAPRSFELVLAAYLHLPAADLDLVLRRGAAALAPGGVLLVVGHDLANLTEGTGRPSDPAVLYTAKSLVRSLDGLVVQRAGQVRRTVLDGEIRREAVDTPVRAARS